jgi:hypothetical protein
MKRHSRLFAGSALLTAVAISAAVAVAQSAYSSLSAAGATSSVTAAPSATGAGSATLSSLAIKAGRDSAGLTGTQFRMYGLDPPIPDVNYVTAEALVPVPGRWFLGQDCTLRTDKAVAELGYQPIVTQADGLDAVRVSLTARR